MRYKLPIILLILLCCCSVIGAAQLPADTVFNPPVLYSSMPRTYEIAGIRVEGAPNYDDEIILGYAGLKVGERVAIPGPDITNAAKRLMRHNLFQQAQFSLEKAVGDKAWILLTLRTQPRISQVNYIGMKKGERDDLQQRLNLIKGNQITQNIVDRVQLITEKYFDDKGFANAKVNITLHEDLSAPGQMIVDIAVDRRDKLKVHKIYLDGNEVLSDRKIKRVMKKTRSSHRKNSCAATMTTTSTAFSQNTTNSATEMQRSWQTALFRIPIIG